MCAKLNVRCSDLQQFTLLQITKYHVGVTSNGKTSVLYLIKTRPAFPKSKRSCREKDGQTDTRLVLPCVHSRNTVQRTYIK
jgi:hypothetical protein